MLVWYIQQPIWAEHSQQSNQPSLCVSIWATKQTNTISTGNGFLIEFAKGRFLSRKRQKIQHIKRRDKRDMKRRKFPSAHRFICTNSIRASISRQWGDEAYPGAVPRTTTTHRERQGRRAKTSPVIQETYGRTAWKNTCSSARTTVCFKDVPRLRVD